MKQRLAVLGVALLISLHAFAGKADTISIFSKAMDTAYKCVVITPDSYTYSYQHYPVLYLLHGYSGNYSDWIKQFPQLKEEVDKYQMIVVCPDGQFSSWYIDSPIDSSFRFETYVGEEVPAYIDQHYRTTADRKHRAITGLSMGGHGAMFLALRHKDIFGAVGSMSGGVDLRPFPNNWDIKKRIGDIKTHPENWEKYSVVNLADSLKNHELAITFTCGVKDFFINVNRELHKKLLKMGIEHDYTERPGQHTWAFWKNAIVYQLLFFDRYFQGITDQTDQ